MIVAPPLRVGIASLGTEPHADLVGILGVLERTQAARERNRLDAKLLAPLFGHFRGGRATLNHRTQVLSRVGDRLLEVDLLRQVASTLVQRFQFEVALRNLVVVAFDGANCVDPVGKGYGLVLKLLDGIHVCVISSGGIAVESTMPLAGGPLAETHFRKCCFHKSHRTRSAPWAP